MEDTPNLDTPPSNQPMNDPQFDGPSKRRIFLPIIIILAIVIGVLMTLKASVHKEAKLNLQPVELTEGNELPNFEMTKLDGTKVTLGDLPHKVMMINFWATWCEACMEEMPSIVALRDANAPKGFEVLGINVDENPQQVVSPVANKFNMKFPIFTDPNNALAEMFDVHAIPLTVVINSKRKILLVESGGREWNDPETQQMLTTWLNE
jgi:peroxiredoxin